MTKAYGGCEKRRRRLIFYSAFLRTSLDLSCDFKQHSLLFLDEMMRSTCTYIYLYMMTLTGDRSLPVQ